MKNKQMIKLIIIAYQELYQNSTKLTVKIELSEQRNNTIKEVSIVQSNSLGLFLGIKKYSEKIETALATTKQIHFKVISPSFKKLR